MAARREPEQSVSLFPFLAVLVCAMGALILLLLVMTRRIRQQAELRAQHEQAVAATTAAPPAAPPPLSIPRPPIKPPVSPARTPNRPRVPLPPPPPVYVDPTYQQRLAAQQAAFEQATAELHRTWTSKVASFDDRRRDVEVEVQSLRTEIQSRRQTLGELDAQAEAVEARRAGTAREDDELQQQLKQLAAERTALGAEIDALERRLQTARGRREQTASQQFTIIPFDALSGTTRRPIVIECRRDRLVFVAESIDVSASDLDGFIPHFNPLAAGVRALADGWRARDGGSEPYILLVVRPEGTIAFYVARALLEPMGVAFGYELVGADQKFTWPQTDPELVAECRAAIDEVLHDRRRVPQLSRVSGRNEDPLQVAGDGGAFRLDEVEQLRDPGRTIQWGAERVDRDEYTVPATQAASRRSFGDLFRRQPDAGAGPATTPAEPQAVLPDADPAPAAVTNAAGPGLPGSGPATIGGARRTTVRDPFNWRPPGGSGISIQRDVPVEVTSQRLRIAGEEPLTISAASTTETLARHLAEGLEAQFADWGPPPDGYYWRPRIKFIVTPGGAVASGRLMPIVKSWGLETTLDYASPLTTIGAREESRQP